MIHETHPTSAAGPAGARVHPLRLRAPATFILAAAILAAAGLGGCASFRQFLGTALVPVQTEIDLGRRLAAEIEAEHRVLRDPQIQRYVRFLAEPLIEQAWRDRPGIDYRVTVLDDPDQVNAFALPGGPTYVFTGLMILAGDESELAGVLAHELGHVVARHSANQLAANLGLQVVAAIALGEDPERLAAAAADFAGGVGMARFSREDELQADDLGLRYVTAAGYDPRGMVRMFQGLQSVGGSSSGPLGGLLATHPATAERIERLQRRIDRMGGDLPQRRQGPRYREMTASLRPTASLHR